MNTIVLLAAIIGADYGYETVPSFYARPVAAPEQPAAAPHRSGYPTSTGDRNRHATRWSGLTNWRHLTDGPHAGKFNHAWLQTLTLSELHALHDDDHDAMRGRGRVKWEFVPKFEYSSAPAAAKPKAAQGCPGGVCGGRPGLLGRILGR